MAEMLDADPAVFEDNSLALQYVINTIINNKINTVEVVRITSVDEENNEVSVIPVVKNVDAKGGAIEESEIHGIKFIRWQHGTNALIAVPEIGDVGLILVSKRDISKIDTGIVDSRRKFNLADGIYIGGLCGFNNQPTQFIKFSADGIEITSQADLTINVQNANINASTSANVISPVVNLGTEEGIGVARIGDNVDLITGKITTGSTIVKAG